MQLYQRPIFTAWLTNGISEAVSAFITLDVNTHLVLLDDKHSRTAFSSTPPVSIGEVLATCRHQNHLRAPLVGSWGKWHLFG